MATLREICRYVRAAGFVPVLAWDFDVPKSGTHDVDLMLLHQCRFAIFEETSPAGELMELERSGDYGILSIVVYQIRDPFNRAPPSQITSMATTYGVPLVPYLTFRELERFVRRAFGAIGRNAIGKAYRVIGEAQWLPPKTRALVTRGLGSTPKRGGNC